jgi:hypothetical protein
MSEINLPVCSVCGKRGCSWKNHPAIIHHYEDSEIELDWGLKLSDLVVQKIVTVEEFIKKYSADGWLVNSQLQSGALVIQKSVDEAAVIDNAAGQMKLFVANALAAEKAKLVKS